MAQTAAQFPSDAQSYRELFEPLVNRYQTLFNEAFRPVGIPRHPFLMARFGWRAMQPATVLAGVHLTLWSGVPTTGTVVWHGFYYEPNNTGLGPPCTSKETATP